VESFTFDDKGTDVFDGHIVDGKGKPNRSSGRTPSLFGRERRRSARPFMSLSFERMPISPLMPAAAGRENRAS